METTECKYGCIDGLYFEPNQRRKLPCPDCSKDRAKNIRIGLGYSENYDENGVPDMVSLQEIVGFPVTDVDRYDFEKVLSRENARSVKSGLNETMSMMQEIMDKAALGVSLPDSYVVGLNSKCNLKHFVASIILSYYKSSGKTYKALSIKDYLALAKTRTDMLNYADYEEHHKIWDKIHSARCLVVFLTSGGNREEIESAKGLMQSRALKGEGTVFVTTMPSSYLRELTTGDEPQMTATGSHIVFEGGTEVDPEKIVGFNPGNDALFGKASSIVGLK